MKLVFPGFLFLLVAFAGQTIGCAQSGFSGGGKTSSKKKADTTEKEQVSHDDGKEIDLDPSSGEEPDSDIDTGDNSKNDIEIEDADDIKKICQKKTEKTLEKTVSFPSTAGCGFGQNGNLPAKGGIVTARAIQKSVIEIPDSAVICSLSIRSDTQSIQYDDFLYLLLGDFVLAGDSGRYQMALATKVGIPVWDWEKVKGMPHDPDVPVFCVGDGKSRCTMPGHDKVGPIELDIDSEATSKIAVDFLGQSNLTLSVVTMGDDESDDCQHTPFEAMVKIRYVQK